MKRLIVIALILLVSGCTDWGGRGRDDLSYYKGIVQIPDNCIQHGDDTCGLFACMVDRCWCHEVGPEGAILYEGSEQVKTEQAAITAVKNYLESNGIGYKSVDRAVQLNNIFYNVFTEDESGDERVYTVAVDGTIILTQCGV